MLKITFQQPENLMYDVDSYFKFNHNPEWFADELVKQMVLDVDKTEIKGPYLAVSPVLGAIPPSEISGGVKALILALKTDLVIYGSACGDNCAKWFIEIGKKKDVIVYFGHLMNFPQNFDAVCLDNGNEIHSIDDFEVEYLRARGYDL